MTDPAQIRAIALDVDGVITDGTVWLGPGGEEYKGAAFLDIMGLARARRAGVPIAFISGEDTDFVHRLAARLGIADVWAGCKDKAAAFRDFGARHGIAPDAMCFMGDDVNDVPSMRLAGFAAAPRTAHRSALAAAAYVTERDGGRGAVREVLDHLAGGAWTAGTEGRP